MGSGALAGNQFRIDRDAVARDLGFRASLANSLDAVSDRDFALDYLFALAELPRISRASPKTSSFSRRRNLQIRDSSRRIFDRQQPDAAEKKSRCWELSAAQTGAITGALLALLTTLQGFAQRLPARLAGRFKKRFFPAHDQVATCLLLQPGAGHHEIQRRAIARGWPCNPVLLATEAADYLVHKEFHSGKRHDIVGKVLREAEKQNVPWIRCL